MTYRLKDFGSYSVGGRILEVTEGQPRKVRFTRSAEYTLDPRGHFAVEQAYVQYFIPEDRRPGPPVLLVHGGGKTGACWETTPDGRPGWLQLLLLRGYEVHVVDNMERGRAGFAPGLWEGEPVLRSLEEAWDLFRIGAPEDFAARRPFPGQLFPAEALEAMARNFAPRWLTTSHLLVKALVAVLERIGPAVVICHSQGGELTFDAHHAVPELVSGIIALEPSGFPRTAAQLAATPFVLVLGDRLDVAEHWRARRDGWYGLAADLAAADAPVSVLDPANSFGPGNSHMLMMDANSEAVLNASLVALEDLTVKS